MTKPAPAPRTPLDPNRTPVASIMSRDVVSVPPHMSVAEFSRLLVENGISGAPVVDERGRPIGVASRTDLLHAAVAEAEDRERPAARRGQVALRTEGSVRDVMTPMAFTIGEDATVMDAVSLMARVGLHRVAVVSAAGRVVGILSSFDVVTWIAGIDRPPRR